MPSMDNRNIPPWNDIHFDERDRKEITLDNLRQ